MQDSNATKRALGQTMKDLMSREPFAKISVGDICTTCGMSRKSFYYHFRDKYDLVNWIFSTEFLQAIHPEGYSNAWELLADMCTYFYEEQSFYRCALQITGQNSFREYFMETVTPLVSLFTTDIFKGVDHAAFYLTFISDGVLMSILRWLTEGAQIPPEEYLHQLRSILLRLAQQTIDELGAEESPPD